jgi:hypothetical protein
MRPATRKRSPEGHHDPQGRHSVSRLNKHTPDAARSGLADRFGNVRQWHFGYFFDSFSMKGRSFPERLVALHQLVMI